MKNLKSTEPIYLGRYGWSSDVYGGEKKSFKTDVCTVWGSTEEELNYRIAMIKKSPEMLESLKDLHDRVNRCRKILEEGHGGDWNILDTQKSESLLKELES